MSEYVIFTDSSADLPAHLAAECGLPVVWLRLFLDEKEENPETDSKNFYDALRNKVIATTSAPNLDDYLSLMEPILQSGKDLLYIAFSSGLSSACHTGTLAADELAEKYPDRKIRVVDTLAASLGQGLLVYLALQKQKAGLSLDETVSWLEENKLHMCHWFTVDDLLFLKRGGRVSAATAVVGTMLAVKPVMHMDDAGHLVSVSKARGRKAALLALFDKAKETAFAPETQIMAISHGDCEEDAEFLAEKLKTELHVPEVLIAPVGTVIGAHSGPGTVALFFLGKER